MILWRTLRPTLAILPNFGHHVLTVSFVQSFIFVFTTRPSAVCKYLLIRFQDLKRLLRTEMRRENQEKIVVVKYCKTKSTFLSFWF